jgi:hypothetical protein
MQLRTEWRQRQSVARDSDRFRGATCSEQTIQEKVVSERVFGAEFHGAAGLFDRAFRLTLPGQSDR